MSLYPAVLSHRQMQRDQKLGGLGRETRLLTESAFDLARALDLRTLLVQADEIKDIHLIEQLRQSERIIWITSDQDEFPEVNGTKDVVVPIPEAALTRMSKLNLALFLAILNGSLAVDERVLCLSGFVGSGHLDMLLVARPSRVLPRFHKHEEGFVATRELARILDITLRFAAEGREGTPIGTIFVLGDMDQLEPYLRQLILNPCAGHTRKDRDIHDPLLIETLREYAAMDGAFVVNLSGTVESAGTYLDAPVRRAKLRAGLGARHAAALAITAATDAVAVALSSSSGTVSVFHEGKDILELEKPFPRRAGHPSLRGRR